MLQPIKSLVSNSIKKYGLKEKIEASQVIGVFHKIIAARFGKKILEQVQAKSLKRGVLRVAVLSSVVANELRLQEGIIIKEINHRFKKTLVKKIRFFF